MAMNKRCSSCENIGLALIGASAIGYDAVCPVIPKIENVHITAVFIAYGIWGNIYEEARNLSSNKNAATVLSGLPVLIAKLASTSPALFKQ